MQRKEENRGGSQAPVPEKEIVPPEKGQEDRPGRRYGLFGVSAYPEKSRMGDRQRSSMARWLSVIIGLMAVAVVLLLLFSSRSTGLTVTFDAMGGSQVSSQSVPYGGTLAEPEETVRPGYRLEGWSIAPDGYALWNFDTDTVRDTLTLYAVWVPDEEEAR